jgi:glycosyltransferase involved in cell wall biosynthesis
MKYTLIVPVYNGEETIGECLASLLDQEGAVHGKDYSVLVVDDGSTDRTQQIVRDFPVELICLAKNQGRIVARLTGAKTAQTDRILFVDSRVTLPSNTIVKLDSFGGCPAVIGEMDSTETKYNSAIHTVLYLIRRRYYGKEFFPIASDLLITEKNFRRAPKGTAVLLIDRDLFIRLTPERTGRDVNDDTLIFHNLVFDLKTGLLRSRRLFFRYSQRTDPKQFSSWLFHRGVRFSDFYLRPGGYFHIPFLLLAVVLAALLALALTPKGFLYLAVFMMGVDAAASLYLSEKPKDFIRVFLFLPPIVVIFGSGIAAFWAKTLSGPLLRLFRRKRNKNKQS